MVTRLQEFQYPFGTVAGFEDGESVVVETQYHRLRVFCADGTLNETLGKQGNSIPLLILYFDTKRKCF